MIMAIDTQELPVTAVGWIIVMIMIFVMHRQQMQIGRREFAATVRTYPWKKLQSTAPIIDFRLWTSRIRYADNHAFHRQGVDAGIALF